MFESCFLIGPYGRLVFRQKLCGEGAKPCLAALSDEGMDDLLPYSFPLYSMIIVRPKCP